MSGLKTAIFSTQAPGCDFKNVVPPWSLAALGTGGSRSLGWKEERAATGRCVLTVAVGCCHLVVMRIPLEILESAMDTGEGSFVKEIDSRSMMACQ